jgi:hypothetical protein
VNNEIENTDDDDGHNDHQHDDNGTENFMKRKESEFHAVRIEFQ